MQMLTSEPVRPSTSWKYGTESASDRITSSSTEPTVPRTAIRAIEPIDPGRLRSSWMAKGANSRAYLVIGVRTVAHKATLVITRPRGRLRVICELTSGPNIFAPMKARVVYRAVTRVKLTIDTYKLTNFETY